jgi:prepilin signal peptidase PulO-like enzyme (type II secretory pathway)
LDIFSFFKIILYIGIFFVGAVLGSFASAIIYRVPRRKSWALKDGEKAARSGCPHCGHTLNVQDLVPVLSWFFSKGKCRYCHKEISYLYPALELFSGFVILTVFYFTGFSFFTLFIITLLPFLLSLAVLQLKEKRLSLQLFIISISITLIFGLVWYVSV